MSKKRLLFLTPRLPYPPNKGDKISTFNMLRFFGSIHDLHLGSFVDDPQDIKHIGVVASRCASSVFVPISPRLNTALSLRGLFNHRPLSVEFYANRRMQAWVDETLRRIQPDAVLIFSGAMGRFLLGRDLTRMRVAFDPEDVDSEKWRQYGRETAFPLSWIYRREARLLLAFERRMARMADVTIFVSEQEAALFRQLAPEVATKVTYRTQGVDCAYFDPSIASASPYAPSAQALVFVGAMNYRPNVEAALWFAKDIFPQLRARRPDAEFWIVGMAPTDDVRALATLEGVHVTGAVDDVRPYVRHAVAACLPLRLARGIQNKALEAMALEKTLVATPEALTGILPYEGFHPIAASTPDEFVAALLPLLAAPPPSDSKARECVLENYSWETNLRRLNDVLFGNSKAHEHAPAPTQS